MRLAKAIGMRLLFGALSLLFITFVAFIADEIAPGDAATQRAGEKATLEQITRIRHEMGLDRPWPIRYGEMVGRMVKGDLGDSNLPTQGKVIDILKRSFPSTLRLAFCAILLAALVGVSLGTLAAVRENKGADRAVLLLSTLGVTVPNFVLAPLLVWVFAFWLKDATRASEPLLAPTWDMYPTHPIWYYLTLPICILAARPAASLTRLTRASMIETMRQEFIRLAIAKGVPYRTLVFKHALRNAILPVVTSLGTSFGFLLTGSFVVERFFVLPGIGKEAIEAIQAADAPVFQGCIVFSGALFLFVNLLVDISLPILDPRIREAPV